MPLNGEELMRQKEYEHDRRNQPTAEEMEIACLEDELNATRNLNDRLDNLVDKQLKQLDQINHAIDLYLKDERKEGVTLDAIMNAVERRR